MSTLTPSRSYRWLFWTLAFTGLLLDQGTKYGVFAWLQQIQGNAWSVFKNNQGQGFHFVAQFALDQNGTPVLDANGRPVPHVNHGALFGFLSKHESLANMGFAIISIFAAAAILFWGSQEATCKDRWLCLALGLILAGTIGNFYDRLVFNGVRDFLHWNYLFDWPVFNVADVCLVCGASTLLLHAFLMPEPETQEKTVSSAQPIQPIQPMSQETALETHNGAA